MSGDLVTYGALKRLSFLPERPDADNGSVIGGQDYYDVFITGGHIANVTLDNVDITLANPLPPSSGGTGVNNGTNTITLGGNFATTGSFSTTLNVTANTNVTLPSTGTLATLNGVETFTNKTLTTPVINTPDINGGTADGLASLSILDSDSTHNLIIDTGSNLTQNRTLNLNTGDNNRTLDISASNVTISSFGATLIDDADASTARTTLGLVIGTNVQAYDAGLQSIAGLTTSANQMIYTTALDTYTTTTLTPFARTILDDVDAATARSTLVINATNTPYSNATSGLTATDTQAAIDEITTRNMVSGNVQVRNNLGTPTLYGINGGQIYVDGKIFIVSAAGLALGTGGDTLTNDTDYYVTAEIGGAGALVVRARLVSTGRTVNSLGIPVMSGVGGSARTIVGLVRRQTGAWATTKNLVRSYYNRESFAASGFFTTNKSTNSTSFVEIDSEIRTPFVIWSDEVPKFFVNAPSFNGTAPQTNFTSVSIDGGTQEDVVSSGVTYTGSTGNQPHNCIIPKAGLSEGYHYATLFGRVAGNTGNWIGSGTVAARTSLYITI